jgi:radical SAM superfamily enzyme YgiQ (UPF0313 family)
MKKLLLINPIPEIFHDRVGTGQGNCPPLNLGYVAALTPDDWEIEIIDESVRLYNGEEADLVGITALTSGAPRAYSIAAGLREKGIPTVMGGIHASMLPDEASKYFNAIVIGEAENSWGQVIADFEKGIMQQRYKGPMSQLDGLPHPKRNLFDKKNYPIRGQVQTARGCPMNCDFCTVTAFNGGTYRQRPVEQVIDELETLDTSFVIFVDDNILGYGPNADQRAIRLFKGIIERGLKIRWFSQASINIANNPEVLRYAAKSGCTTLFIGFESINEDALRNMHKTVNLKTGVAHYKECIDRINDNGISIAGGFILGDDMDTKDVFDRTIEFVMKSKLDAGQFIPLNPMPGTRVYERLRKENRLLFTNYPHDWMYHDNHGNVLFRPKHMSPDELQEGILRIYRETTKAPRAFARFVSTLARTGGLWPAGIAYMWNHVLSSEFIKRYGTNKDRNAYGSNIINDLIERRIAPRPEGIG